MKLISVIFYNTCVQVKVVPLSKVSYLLYHTLLPVAPMKPLSSTLNNYANEEHYSKFTSMPCNEHWPKISNETSWFVIKEYNLLPSVLQEAPCKLI